MQKQDPGAVTEAPEAEALYADEPTLSELPRPMIQLDVPTARLILQPHDGATHR